MEKVPTYEELKEKVQKLEEKTVELEKACSKMELREEWHHALFNHPASAIYIHDVEGDIIDVNQTACFQTGYRREELVAMQVFDLHSDCAKGNHPSKSKILQQWQNWAPGESFRLTAEHRRKDNSVFPVEIYACVIESGGDRYIMSTVFDITQQDRTKKALEESEPRFRMLYQEAPISYQSLDIEGRFVEVNQAWLDTLGYQRDDVIGRSFADFLHPDWQQHFKDNFPRFKAVGEILGVEFEMVRKDKTVILVSFTGKIGCDSEGNFLQTHCVLEDISAKREHEIRLAESERKYRMLAENLPDVVYRMSLPRGIYEYVSPASKTIFGYEPEEWYTNPLLIADILPPEWQGYFEEKWRNLLEGKVDPFYEYQVIHKSGKLKWIHQRNVGQYDETGKIVAIEGVVTDITERQEVLEKLQKSEKALEGSNRDLKLAQRIANVGNWHFDQAVGTPVWSEEVFRIYERDPALGPYALADYQNIYQGEYFERFHDAISRAIEKGEPYDIELQLVVPSGKIKWINAICEPEKARGEQGHKLHGTIQDITVRKEAEEALKESEQRFKRIIERSPLPMVISDHNQDILFFNDKFTELFGYTLDDVQTAEQWWKTVYPDEEYRKTVQLSWRRAIEKAQSENREIEMQQFYFTTKEGSRRAVEFYMVPMGDIGLSIMRDITEKRQLEEKLHQAQRLESIGNLAGGIAHEFNNILSIIMGNNELIMDELPKSGFARECAGEIRVAGLRARDVVKQLLTFSRQDATAKNNIDTTAVVTESIKLLRATIPTNIAMETDIHQVNKPVFGSETQLNQVIINLCKNSADAIGSADGKIAITLDTIKNSPKEGEKKQQNWVRLRVSDTGEGMNEAVVKRIFEPYFTTKGVGKGTGIGLAVVHGVVESHGGAIDVQSVPHEGTTFTILLPVADQELESGQEATETLPGGDEHILIVDDEPSICTITEKRLESLGYTATTFTDPIKALRSLRKDPARFDMVLSDMAMPHMTGEKLLVEVKNLREEIATVLCTGYSEVLSEENSHQYGIDAFVLKPVSKKELAEKVRMVLDRAAKE